jgi:hypothetical protein
VLLWLLVVGAVVRAAGSRRERGVLIGLTLASVLVGPAILFGVHDGFSGSGDYLDDVVFALLIPGVIGAGVALGTGSVHPGRAFFVSVWGALFLVGGWFVLVISLLAIGSGCIS